MKPDWEKLPKWAKFIAMDESGRWCWFDKKPRLYGSFWLPPEDGKCCCAKNKNWTKTIENRPLEKKLNKRTKTC